MMVEVDPRLFVTCRLCLEVEGQFQIIPSVQEQIKYCFDIDVEPFDCLPQLVCRKCQQILSQYYNIKQTFLEKQKELKTKVQGNVKQISNLNSLQQHEPASSSSSVNNKSSRKKKHKSKKVRKRRPTTLGTSSSDELDPNDLSKHSSQKSDSDSSSSVVSNKSSRKKKHKIKRVNKRILNKLATSSSDELDHTDAPAPEIREKKCTNEDPILWEANLCKYLVCRICSKKFQNKEGIRKHIREHSNLHTKYKNIFNKCCLVVIEKIDGKPNVTKSDKAVMHSCESYIENEHNPYYYIMYHPKNYQFSPNNAAHQSRLIENNDITIHENMPRKRRRIMSSETVVINPNEHRNDMTQIIDCIDIDDSSDNESCESNDKSQTSSVDYKNDESLDSKSVSNIIRMCFNRYTKRFDLSKRNISANNISKLSSLQHKVLSIGRKIINKRGINCTGLLRFLEHKDLKVVWKETCIMNTSTDSKFVRIAIGMNGNDSSDSHNEGWKNINEFKQDDVDSSRVYILRKMKALENFKGIQNSGNQKQLISEDTNSMENLPRISSVFSHRDLEISKTVEPENNPQKLLNTSPVLHPKQLPKSKVNNIESSSMNITRVFSGVSNSSAAQLEKIQVIRNDEEANDSSMPIIQSTESLAPWVENGVASSSVPNENHAKPQVQYPRIKVKSFSQLMPEKSANNTQYTNAINAIQSGTQSTDSQNVPNTFRNFDNSMNCYSPTTNTIYTIQSDTQFANSQNVPNSFGTIDRTKNYQILHNPVTIYIPPNNGPADQQKALKESVIVNDSSRITNAAKECIIMHTADLPNEKTDSPFKYLKNLLQIHSMTLLDTDSPLPPESTCLINLRYLYQQENRDPVALTWSLFCCKNIFCIKVRDVQHRDISLSKLSAQWQWQFLKIYNNDVLNNVLDTAKKIGIDTYNYTRNFFTLIQSIQCRTV